MQNPHALRERWPTWLAILALYCAWLLLTYQANTLPFWLLAPLAAVVLTFHGSVQHELIHGHLTPWRWVNRLFAVWPLNLWIPYECYRRSHLEHHEVAVLTQPESDPESYYWYAPRWASLGGGAQRLFRWNHTVLGRLLLGPILSLILFYKEEWQKLWARDRDTWLAWGEHVLSLVPVLYWVLVVCEIPFWQYLLLFVFPGVSLSMLRSYLEHRPEADNRRRCAVVEGSWFSRLLFLNVNIHVVHHDMPQLPWYKVYREFLNNRDKWLALNGHYYFPNYRQVVRQHFIDMKDNPVYPKPLSGA